MNLPPPQSWKWLVLAQILAFFAILAMPLIVRALDGPLGKAFYAVLAVILIAISVRLRRLLDGPEG